MSSAPRRPRRAVRPSGTVGTDDSVLLARLPALPPATPGADEPLEPAGGPGLPKAVAAGGDTDDLWRATRSADDSDRGWGREEPSSNEERLRREKPPHW